MFRTIPRQNAEPFNEGCDPELIEARQRAPEPTRFEYPHLRVPLYRNRPFSFEEFTDPNARLEVVQIADFERVLVRSEEGSIFWAWKSCNDQRHYL